QLFECDAERVEDPLHRLVRVTHLVQTRKPQEQVLRPDVAMTHPGRLVLRESEHALGSVGESIEWRRPVRASRLRCGVARGRGSARLSNQLEHSRAQGWKAHAKGLDYS